MTGVQTCALPIFIRVWGFAFFKNFSGSDFVQMMLMNASINFITNMDCYTGPELVVPVGSCSSRTARDRPKFPPIREFLAKSREIG